MLQITPFRKLGLMYLIALASIVLTILVSQVLIQSFIEKQSFDSRVINVAGKQRMLSQKISKIALKILNEPNNPALFNDLRTNAKLWEYSHSSLLNGSDSLGVSGENSPIVIRLYDDVTPYYSFMLNNINGLLSADRHDSLAIATYVDGIINTEEEFLKGMDAIVYQYDQEARQKVQRLSRLEYTLFAIAIAIVILEFVFLFRPTSRKVVQTFNELIKSEDAAKKMTSEVNKLYTELGKSYQDLESVNIEPEEPSILLKCNEKGKIEFVSEKFREIMSMDSEEFEMNLYKWLSKEGYNEDFLAKLENIIDLGESWSGELNVTDFDGDIIWLDMYFQPVPTGNGSSNKRILAIGRDVTEVKEAKQRSREINREAIEKRVKEQQYRSVLILEGQEEERKRISAEIHDGIGQMLTALKLNLEGITPTSAPHMKKRIKDTKELMKSVIKEVRRVSFNLAPSSLVDFGITPALKKISQEVSALTSTKVLFENRTGFINRLDKIVETNLYRIVQEAVNNCIKYSEASEIKISIEHTYNQLMVSVEDNGKGFEKEKLEKAGHFGASGHGIFNMKERAAYINAQFDVDTKLNRGTKITLTLPLS